MTSIFRRQSFLKKMMMSFCFALSLPIILIWGYLFPQLEQHMLDNVRTNQKNNIARLATTLDQNISSMVTGAVSLSENHTLTSYSTRQSPLGDYNTVHELKKSSFWTNSFVSQTFYYVKKSNRFYTNSASYPFEWLTSTDYGYCYYDWDAESMYHDLQSLVGIEIRPMEKVAYPDHLDSHVISVLMPIPVASNSPYAVLIMWIDRAVLDNLISPLYSDSIESILLYDNKGKSIFSFNADEFEPDCDNIHAALSGQSKNGTALINLNGTEYLFASVCYESSGWRCVSLIPASSVYREINAMRYSLILSTLLLAVASITVLVLASRKTSRSISDLESKALMYVSSDSSRDQLDTVHNALDQLGQQAEKMQQRYIETIPLLKERWIYALISGQYISFDDFNRVSAGSGVRFTLPEFSVTIIRTTPDDSADILEYLESLESVLPNGLEGYYVFAFDRRDIIFVCAAHTSQTALVYLNDIFDDISTTFHQQARLAIGISVTSAAKAHLSYNSAAELIEKMTFMGRIGVEQATGSHNKAEDLFPAQTSSLAFSIIKKDSASIQRAVEQILNFIRDDSVSLFMIRALYINTVDLLLRGLDNMDFASEQLSSLAILPDRITYEAMADNLHKLETALCSCIDEGQREIDINIDNVTDYIQKHCLEYEFCVQNIADYFKMSYTGFSHYFKRKMNKSCKQFVDEYRAEKAIEILMNTVEPLEVISQRVGFGNTTSFIRSFKKVTGRTPGSYRNA